MKHRWTEAGADWWCFILNSRVTPKHDQSHRFRSRFSMIFIKWSFPEIGLPPNHPNFLMAFSLINQPLLGTPPLMRIPISSSIDLKLVGAVRSARPCARIAISTRRSWWNRRRWCRIMGHITFFTILKRLMHENSYHWNMWTWRILKHHLLLDKLIWAVWPRPLSVDVCSGIILPSILGMIVVQ